MHTLRGGGGRNRRFLVNGIAKAAVGVPVIGGEKADLLHRPVFGDT
jgi:hypothetical protein